VCRIHTGVQQVIQTDPLRNTCVQNQYRYTADKRTLFGTRVCRNRTGVQVIQTDPLRNTCVQNQYRYTAGHTNGPSSEHVCAESIQVYSRSYKRTLFRTRVCRIHTGVQQVIQTDPLRNTCVQNQYRYTAGHTNGPATQKQVSCHQKQLRETYLWLCGITHTGTHHFHLKGRTI
jgi:hypothetical protein